MTEVIAGLQVALAVALTGFWIGQLLPPFESLQRWQRHGARG